MTCVSGRQGYVKAAEAAVYAETEEWQEKVTENGK